jgi:serine phosphatase RsbU (regulator of sigma subunit)
MRMSANGKVDVLTAPGTPVGGQGGVELGFREEKVAKGDRIFVFTDGVPELELHKRQFGLRRVAKLLESTRGQPLDVAHEAIVAELARHGAHDRADDITFVLLDVT